MNKFYIALLKRRVRSLAIITFVLLCIAMDAAAEQFRVHQLLVAKLDTTGEEATVDAVATDSVAVFLPADITFFRGIELNIKIPEEIAGWRDSVAYSFYRNITPLPQAGTIDYEGTKDYLSTLPAKLSWTLQIPLTKDSSFETTPYTTILPVIPDITNRFIFFRMQPAMKGIPESALNSKLKISVKPVYFDEGRLTLDISGPSADIKPYTVFVDDKNISLDNGKCILATGVHTVSIVSDYYRNEIRTVQINQAQDSLLAIKLRDIAPTVRVTAPQSTIVYLDDTELTTKNQELVVTPGDHKIRFVIGDYEVVKTVSAKDGHSYTVSLSIDATVAETE
jgi:hypothetical protein